MQTQSIKLDKKFLETLLENESGYDSNAANQITKHLKNGILVDGDRFCLREFLQGKKQYAYKVAKKESGFTLKEYLELGGNRNDFDLHKNGKIICRNQTGNVSQNRGSYEFSRHYEFVEKVWVKIYINLQHEKENQT